MSASVPKDEFALSEFQENGEAESVYGETARYFEARGLAEHLQVLTQITREEMEPVEEAVRAKHPQLSATAVDAAAHGAMRRLWAVAPKVGQACPTVAEFKRQLYKVLRPCVMHAGQDEVRKAQRRLEILEAEFFRHWEVEHEGLVHEPIGPAEVEELLQALGEELGRMKCPLTLAVLEVIRDYNWQNADQGGPGCRALDMEYLLKALRERHVALRWEDLARARARIRLVAERVMREHNWWLHAVPQAGVGAGARTAGKEEE